MSEYTHYEIGNTLRRLGLTVDSDPNDNNVSFIRLPNDDHWIGRIIGDAEAVIQWEGPEVYRGAGWDISYDGTWFTLNDNVGPDREYDSFEDLVEDNPICEEARDFFFGQDDLDA